MASFEQLCAQIDAHHFAEPCADAGAIDELEKRFGIRLPEDLKYFYRRYATAKLFDSEAGPAYRFVPLDEMRRTRIDIYGPDHDSDAWGPAGWLTVCDVQDGNYIAIDAAPDQAGAYNYIDCFHETFAEPGESTVIAKSFTELLARALESKGSAFYLEKDFVDYGDGRPLTAENAALRVDNPEAPKKGWLVRFSIGKSAPYQVFFTDDEYGSRDLALEAVRRFIDARKS